MRNFVYVIGSTDDFSSLEELQSWYRSADDVGMKNCSFYPVSLSDSTVVSGYRSLGEVATMIGRGEAMSDGWCLDDTLSFIMEE